MDYQLNQKVALITGSGRGIGLACAFALAREGARIVITDINPESVIGIGKCVNYKNKKECN